MQLPDIIDEPEDIDVLAAQAVDQRRSEGERVRGFSGLRGLIRRLAVSLSIRLTGRIVPEFTDGADGEVYLRLGGFTPSGSFAAWCHRTLHNWMVDELRKASRRQEHEREAARLRAEARPAEPLADGLSQQELDDIGGWHPGQRLALLCLTGLWRDVPEGIWRQWCEAFTPGGEQLQTRPFPPQEFEMCPDQQERADILAQLLRVRRGTLAVWVHRCACLPPPGTAGRMNWGAMRSMDITWNNVPLHGHPVAVGVLVETHVWRKIGEKHMANPNEPWDEWMEATLVDGFQALWPLGCQNDADRFAVQSVSDCIHQGALASLEAPLLMKYDYRQVNKSRQSSQPQRIGSLGNPESTQRLVLPSRAQAEIRRRVDGTWSLRSCYFDKSEVSRAVPSWQRYRRLVSSLRGRYLRAPDPAGLEINDPYPKEDSIETGIEFVSPHNWGLEASTPPDPWNHLPPPWPQPPAAPGAPPPGLLRPPPGGGTTA